jgi:hypothetical protein
LAEGASVSEFNLAGDLWDVNGATNILVAYLSAISQDGNWTIAQIYFQGGVANKSCIPVNLTKHAYMDILETHPLARMVL